MTVCEAFGLTVSEAKTKTICLRTRGIPDAATTFSVEAASQVYKQTYDFVYLGGNVNHDADLSIEVDRCIRNAWCSFRKYSLELYDRPSVPLELKIDPDAISRSYRVDAVRLRHMEPTLVPLRYPATSPPQLPDPLHQMAKHKPTDHPISYVETL